MVHISKVCLPHLRIRRVCSSKITQVQTISIPVFTCPECNIVYITGVGLYILQRAYQMSLSRSVPLAGIFEPDDLKLEPDIPEYPTLHLRIRGFDFVSLESYAKHVHRMTDRLGLDSNAWAVPARSKEVKTFKPGSTVVENKYNLQIFERTVQIDQVPSPTLPILLEMMRTHAPEGVQVTLKEPDEEEEEFRYIPDKEMQDLRQQMKAIDDAREERRRK